jgi:hypothetical protein
LELDLLLIALPLVFDVELGAGGHVDPLPGNLDLEALAGPSESASLRSFATNSEVE